MSNKRKIAQRLFDAHPATFEVALTPRDLRIDFQACVAGLGRVTQGGEVPEDTILDLSAVASEHRNHLDWMLSQFNRSLATHPVVPLLRHLVADLLLVTAEEAQERGCRGYKRDLKKLVGLLRSEKEERPFVRAAEEIYHRQRQKFFDAPSDLDFIHDLLKDAAMGRLWGWGDDELILELLRLRWRSGGVKVDLPEGGLLSVAGVTYRLQEGILVAV